MKIATINGLQATEEQLEEALVEFNESDYPRCFKSKYVGVIVLFTGLRQGAIIKGEAQDGYVVGKQHDSWTPHTDITVWEEIPYDKVHGFYEKQLVYCWEHDDTHGAYVRFWDAKNSQPYAHGGANGVRWRYYSAIMPEHMLEFKE